MYISPYDVMRVTARRAEENERRAQIRRLIQEAKASQTPWMPRWVIPLLRWAGRTLVAVGQWLEQAGAPLPGAIERRANVRGY
jgi:hypothetical protein